MKTTTIAFKTKNGFVKHVLCTESNPKNFKIGDKFIVINSGVNIGVKTVESEIQAEKLNNSILNEKNIRRVCE